MGWVGGLTLGGHSVWSNFNQQMTSCSCTPFMSSDVSTLSSFMLSISLSLVAGI